MNATDKKNMSPLHCASWKGQTDAVTCLLENGSQLAEADSSLKTALHWTVQFGHYDTLISILKVGGQQSFCSRIQVFVYNPGRAPIVGFFPCGDYINIPEVTSGELIWSLSSEDRSEWLKSTAGMHLHTIHIDKRQQEKRIILIGHEFIKVR